MPDSARQSTPTTRDALRITWLGALLDGALGALKLLGGWLFHSQALMADGIHSLSDLLTDCAVVVLIKIAGEDADANHPYGHRRFETLGSAMLGMLLILVGAAMALQTVRALLDASPTATPTWPALAIAMLSLLCKEWIYRKTRAVGEQLGSTLLIANAWHSRSDALSSLVVLLGVGGAMLGVAWLDPLAALAVAALIGKVGWDFCSGALRELVDTAAPPEQRAALEKAVREVEGIIDVHDLKTRGMGAKIALEMHLQVAPKLSASESHYLGDRVVMHLLTHFDNLAHIICHIDVEHDGDGEGNTDGDCAQLPFRSEVVDAITEALRGFNSPDKVQAALGALTPRNLVLHYLDGKIELELFIDANALNLSDTDLCVFKTALQVTLKTGLRNHNWFGGVQVWD